MTTFVGKRRPRGIQSGQASSGPTVPFSPSDVTGLRQWLDPSDALNRTIVSSKYSQLTDKSGGGFHATQGTAGLRFPLASAAQNGLDAATCVAADETNMTFSGSVIDVTKKHTYCFAMKINAAQNGIVFYGAAGGPGLFIRNIDTGGRADIRYYGGEFSNDNDTPTGVAAGTWAVYTVVADHSSTVAGTPKWYINGTLVYTGASAVTDAALDPTIDFGGSINPTFHVDGLLGEFLIYEGALSDANRTALETYMSRWT